MTDRDQSTRICPGCGRELSTVHAFCPYCGVPRGPGVNSSTSGSTPSQGERNCPGCGRNIPEGLRFCPYCGRPGPNDRTPTSGPASASSQPSIPTQPSSNANPKVSCISCGKEVPNGLNFCPMCGKAAPYARASPPVVQNVEVKMRKCFGCGRDIPVGLNFCPYCGRPDNAPVGSAASADSIPSSPQEGEKIIRTCIGCGREIRERLAFCPYCGRPAPLGEASQGQSVAQAGPVQTVNKAKCMDCGREFPDNLNFCPYCGRVNIARSRTVPSPEGHVAQPTMSSQPSANNQSAIRLCQGCGKQIPEGLKFCPYCGRPGPTINPPT